MYLRALTLAALTTASLTATTVTAGAQDRTDARCQITMQPWDHHVYELALLGVDGRITTLASQGDPWPDDPADRTWTINPAETDSVLWAARRLPAVAPDDFFDRLTVTMSCDFANPYHAQPGKPDSVTITDTPTPPPTASSSTTVITVASTLIEQRDTPLPTTPASDEPPTTLAGREVPAPTPPPVLAPPTTRPSEQVDLFTATSPERRTLRALPATGAGTAMQALIAATTIVIGMCVLMLANLPVRRRAKKEHHQR